MDSRTPLFVILKRQLTFLSVALVLMIVTGVVPKVQGIPLVASVFGGMVVGIIAFAALLTVTRSDTVVGSELRAEVRKTSRVVRSFSLRSVLVISIVVGFSEELLFRVLIQGWLSESLHYSVGIGVGAIVFGLMHPGSKPRFVFTSLYGVMFGVAYHWTESIVFVMVWHAAYDFLALLFIVKAPQQYFAGRGSG